MSEEEDDEFMSSGSEEDVPWNTDVQEEYHAVVRDDGSTEAVLAFFDKYPECAQNVNVLIYGSDAMDGHSDSSPLSVAIQYQRVPIVHLLIEGYKADPNFPPDAYRTGTRSGVAIFLKQSPIYLAMSIAKDFALVNYLKDMEAQMNTYVVKAVIQDAIDRANGNDEAEDVAAQRVCVWLRNCFLRYPELKTNELENGEGKREYWFQFFIFGTLFNGMHRFLALLFSLHIQPDINRYYISERPTSVLAAFTRVMAAPNLTVKKLDSYMESIYLLYIRSPMNDPPTEQALHKWIDFVYPHMQEASKIRFSLLNGGIPCTPENMKQAWLQDKKDHATFQSTLFAFYSVQYVPRLGQASPLRILPTDILYRLSEMLGQGTLKQSRDMVIPPVLFDIVSKS